VCGIDKGDLLEKSGSCFYGGTFRNSRFEQDEAEQRPANRPKKHSKEQKNENKCEIKQQKHAKHATKYKQNFANHKKKSFHLHHIA
jgi:hypothetical protein